ncbi:MAG: hypothetical protein AVDCRST_MAG40-663, partial [uncultured Gemmatimonadaceae bacterium]
GRRRPLLGTARAGVAAPVSRAPAVPARAGHAAAARDHAGGGDDPPAHHLAGGVHAGRVVAGWAGVAGARLVRGRGVGARAGGGRRAVGLRPPRRRLGAAAGCRLRPGHPARSAARLLRPRAHRALPGGDVRGGRAGAGRRAAGPRAGGRAGRGGGPPRAVHGAVEGAARLADDARPLVARPGGGCGARRMVRPVRGAAGAGGTGVPRAAAPGVAGRAGARLEPVPPDEPPAHRPAAQAAQAVPLQRPARVGAHRRARDRRGAHARVAARGWHQPARVLRHAVRPARAGRAGVAVQARVARGGGAHRHRPAALPVVRRRCARLRGGRHLDRLAPPAGAPDYL